MKFGSCYVHVENDVLTLGNSRIERSWSITPQGVVSLTLVDRENGRVWSARPATQPALDITAAGIGAPMVTCHVAAQSPVEEPALIVELRSPADGGVSVTRRLWIYESASSITLQVVVSGATEIPAVTPDGVVGPTGVETTAAATAPGIPRGDVVDLLELCTLHHRLTAVELVDQTDVHDTLVFERSWVLQPAEPCISASGNIFFIEDPLTGQGVLWLKQAPLPHSRPVRTAVDMWVEGGTCAVVGHGLDGKGGGGYPVACMVYAGGRAGRIAVLQQHQRQFRKYVPERDGRFLSNTWGDRSQDTRVNEAFMLREVEAGAGLGVDVIQIDDGWQRGHTANSAAPGGVWNGFWAADSHFWAPHPQRFPQGLTPILRSAQAKGLRLGLWFAPDSSGNFSNWARDAAQILKLHREWGVDYIKIDGVKMHTRTGEANLQSFFARVLAESEGRVVFDQDVTAEIRPGYFGLMGAGPIFVENRYTDWHRYWPHATLRNLWMLASYVDPVRLRMEFLNVARHPENYPNDPLAPIHYTPGYLFATVMMANPLGWFEVSNLPETYRAELPDLVRTWKTHRAALHAGPILPVGTEPSGRSWTGFVSGAAEGAWYALVFRELNEVETFHFEAPMARAGQRATLLAGAGTVQVGDGGFDVTLPSARSFALIRVEAGIPDSR
jgi:alpha-galactosidase